MSKYKTYGMLEEPKVTELILIEGWQDAGVFSVDEWELSDFPELHCTGCFFEHESIFVCCHLPTCTGVNFHLTTHNPNE